MSLPNVTDFLSSVVVILREVDIYCILFPQKIFIQNEKKSTHTCSSCIGMWCVVGFGNSSFKAINNRLSKLFTFLKTWGVVVDVKTAWSQPPSHILLVGQKPQHYNEQPAALYPGAEGVGSMKGLAVGKRRRCRQKKSWLWWHKRRSRRSCAC